MVRTLCFTVKDGIRGRFGYFKVSGPKAVLYGGAGDSDGAKKKCPEHDPEHDSDKSHIGR
jgi:hypothetical protein